MGDEKKDHESKNPIKEFVKFLSPGEELAEEFLKNLSVGDQGLDEKFWKFLADDGRKHIANISSIVGAPFALVTGAPLVYMAMKDIGNYPEERRKKNQDRINQWLAEKEKREKKEKLVLELAGLEAEKANLEKEIKEKWEDADVLSEIVDTQNGLVVKLFKEVKSAFGKDGISDKEANEKYFLFLRNIQTWNLEDAEGKTSKANLMFQELFQDAKDDKDRYTFLDSKLRPILMALALRFAQIPEKNLANLDNKVGTLTNDLRDEKGQITIDTLRTMPLADRLKRRRDLVYLQQSIRSSDPRSEYYIRRQNLTQPSQARLDTVQGIIESTIKKIDSINGRGGHNGNGEDDEEENLNQQNEEQAAAERLRQQQLQEDEVLQT